MKAEHQLRLNLRWRRTVMYTGIQQPHNT
jgi:hypothetical protein